jgi:hypothetical protein
MKLFSKIGSSSLRTITVMLVLSLVFTVAWGRSKSNDQSKNVVNRTMVVFPLDKISGASIPDNVDFADMSGGILFTSLYKVKISTVYLSQFNKRNPSLQRAISEGRFKSDQLEPPYNDDFIGERRAVTLARECYTKLATAGTLTAYNYDATTQTLSVTLVVDVLNVADGKIVASSGHAGKATATKAEDEVALLKLALEQASDLIAVDVKKMMETPPSATTAPPSK